MQRAQPAPAAARSLPITSASRPLMTQYCGAAACSRAACHPSHPSGPAVPPVAPAAAPTAAAFAGAGAGGVRSRLGRSSVSLHSCSLSMTCVWGGGGDDGDDGGDDGVAHRCRSQLTSGMAYSRGAAWRMEQQQEGHMGVAGPPPHAPQHHTTALTPPPPHHRPPPAPPRPPLSAPNKPRTTPPPPHTFSVHSKGSTTGTCGCAASHVRRRCMRAEN